MVTEVKQKQTVEQIVILKVIKKRNIEIWVIIQLWDRLFSIELLSLYWWVKQSRPKLSLTSIAADINKDC